MRLATILFALAVLAVFVSSPLQASALSSGQIEGTVTDSVSGEKLPGATVWLEGSGFGASVDKAGKYVIARIPPGKYTMVVRYIGYVTKRATIEVKADDQLVRNVVLAPEAVEGETVVVLGQARGQQAAINEQLSSNTITNVVSSEKIHELPDASAATALSRLPGVSLMNGDQVVIRGIQAKLNTVLINGIQVPSTDMTDRATNLGFISSNLLSGIEVIKALTPDLDANTIGGVVNLKLREAPSDFHGDVFLQGNYNTMNRTRDSYKAWASVSDRFFDDNLGIFVQANADRTNQGQNSAVATFGIYGSNDIAYGQAPYKMNSFAFTDQWNVALNTGGSIIVDYRLPNGKLVLQNTYTNSANNNTSFINTLDFVNNERDYSMFRNDYGKDLMINALQAEYELGGVKAEFTLSHSSADEYTHMRYGDPGNFFGFYNTADQPFGSGVDYSSGTQPLYFTYDDIMHLYLDPNDAYKANVQGWVTTKHDAFVQHMYNTSLDLTVPWTITEDIVSKFKAGGKLTRTTRKNDVEGQFNGAAQDDFFTGVTNFFPDHLGLSSGNRTMFTDVWNTKYARSNYFMNGEYPFLYAMDRDLMDRYMLASIAGWVRPRHMPISEKDDFDGAEVFSAGYLMGTFDLGPQITLVAGARFEHFNMKYRGRFVICTHSVYGTGVEPDTLNYVDRNDNNIFPSAQIRYKVNDWSDVRLAVTEGVSRPDYNAIMPSIYYEQGATSTAGNPKLKPAISTNADLSYSVYSNEVGLLTVGGFFKKIVNFFYSTSIYYQNLSYYSASYPDSAAFAAVGLTKSAMPTAGQSITTYLNNPWPAYVRGLEVEWQTNFWYLPKPLNILVLTANYTRAWSDMDYQQVLNTAVSYQDGRITKYHYYTTDTVRNARLLYQSDDVVNVAVGADYEGFSGRISFSMQGNVITSVGSRPETDQYTGNIYRWDLTLQQKLPIEGFKVILDAVNLFNNPTYTYQDFRRSGGAIVQNVQSKTYSPRFIELSLRYSL